MRGLKHPPIEDVAIEHVFHALSDPIRLKIVRRLARDGEAPCNAIDCGRAKSSLSRHYQVLRDAGLIRTRSDGVVRMNALRRDDLERRFPGLLAAVIGAAEAAVADERPD